MSDDLESGSGRASETVKAILKSTTGNDRWEIQAPLHVPVVKLLKKILSGVSMATCNDQGNIIPYRLYYEEKEKYLLDAETLQQAGFQAGHCLVIAQEARAGANNKMTSRKVLGGNLR